MSQLDREDIAEFQSLYKKVYGEEISEQEAARRARNLLAFYEAIYCGGECLEGKTRRDPNH